VSVPKAPTFVKPVGVNAKYLIVVTHTGHTLMEAQTESAQIFTDDKNAKYVYFLDGIGFERSGKIVSGKVDLNNVTELQTYFPGAF
jgi:hypothetical protein